MQAPDKWIPCSFAGNHKRKARLGKDQMHCANNLVFVVRSDPFPIRENYPHFGTTSVFGSCKRVLILGTNLRRSLGRRRRRISRRPGITDTAKRDAGASAAQRITAQDTVLRTRYPKLSPDITLLLVERWCERHERASLCDGKTQLLGYLHNQHYHQAVKVN